MSEETVAVLRRAVEMFNARLDVEAAVTDLYRPDVEVRDLQRPPGVPEVVRGRAQAIAMLEAWMELFDDWSVEVYEFVDLDPWVVCDIRWQGTGKGSDVEVEWRVADAYEVRGGQIARVIHNFPDLATATAVVRATLKTVKGSRN